MCGLLPAFSGGNRRRLVVMSGFISTFHFPRFTFQRRYRAVPPTVAMPAHAVVFRFAALRSRNLGVGMQGILAFPSASHIELLVPVHSSAAHSTSCHRLTIRSALRTGMSRISHTVHVAMCTSAGHIISCASTGHMISCTCTGHIAASASAGHIIPGSGYARRICSRRSRGRTSLILGSSGTIVRVGILGAAARCENTHQHGAQGANYNPIRVAYHFHLSFFAVCETSIFTTLMLWTSIAHRSTH